MDGKSSEYFVSSNSYFKFHEYDCCSDIDLRYIFDGYLHKKETDEVIGLMFKLVNSIEYICVDYKDLSTFWAFKSLMGIDTKHNMAQVINMSFATSLYKLHYYPFYTDFNGIELIGSDGAAIKFSVDEDGNLYKWNTELTGYMRVNGPRATFFTRKTCDAVNQIHLISEAIYSKEFNDQFPVIDVRNIDFYTACPSVDLDFFGDTPGLFKDVVEWLSEYTGTRWTSSVISQTSKVTTLRISPYGKINGDIDDSSKKFVFSHIVKNDTDIFGYDENNKAYYLGQVFPKGQKTYGLKYDCISEPVTVESPCNFTKLSSRSTFRRYIKTGENTLTTVFCSGHRFNETLAQKAGRTIGEILSNANCLLDTAVESKKYTKVKDEENKCTVSREYKIDPSIFGTDIKDVKYFVENEISRNLRGKLDDLIGKKYGNIKIKNVELAVELKNDNWIKISLTLKNS